MGLAAGRNFGNYEILRLLGQGGMGEVYLASDRRLKRQVAIKVLSAELTENREHVSRFSREASFAAVLNHPNICTIYETGEIQGQTYISMEYVEGVTLREYISAEPMQLIEVLDISIQIADALEEARKRNLVHRDIKSSNILITSRKMVKILDFGLAKLLPTFKSEDYSEASTALSTEPGVAVRGTIAYMPPELVLGKKVDHRSDIFSFGVVLYEMLTGRLPFGGSTITEVIDAILHKEPTPATRYNDHVPDALMRVLNKMMEKDPDNRYQSVHEVWVDLKRIKEENTKTSLITAAQPPKRQRFFTGPLPVIAAAVVIAVLLLGSYLLRQRLPTPQEAGIDETNQTLAVLPFQYAGDDEHKYFGSLVTDALIIGLESVPGVAIAPYASVRKLREDSSVKDAARELGVGRVVRGKVLVEGNQLLIIPELASSKGETLWRQELRGFVDRPISTLDTLKKTLVRELHLSDDSSKAIGQLRTPRLEAYRNYLEARSLHERWDVKENLDEAVGLYNKALQSDPDFAAAHAGLAMALVSLYLKTRKPSLLVSASEEAQRALTLDPNLPEVLIASGLIDVERGNSVVARAAFGRALELAPGNDEACRYIAYVYANLGRHAEAKEMYEQAIALRPSYWINHYELGRFHYQLGGDLEAARSHLLKASELDLEGYAPLVVLGLVDLARGDLKNAENSFRIALKRSPNLYAQNNLGLVYYYRGQYDLALRNWQALLKAAPDKPLYETNVADAFRQLGEHDAAQAHYKKAIEGFRASIAANPQDDKSRAGLALALAAIGQCKEAKSETRAILKRHPKSPELAGFAVITIARCGDHSWATQIALDLIAAKNLETIRFDPDLEPIRKVPEVKQALNRTGDVD